VDRSFKDRSIDLRAIIGQKSFWEGQVNKYLRPEESAPLILFAGNAGIPGRNAQDREFCNRAGLPSFKCLLNHMVMLGAMVRSPVQSQGARPDYKIPGPERFGREFLHFQQNRIKGADSSGLRYLFTCPSQKLFCPMMARRSMLRSLKTPVPPRRSFLYGPTSLGIFVFSLPNSWLDTPFRRDLWLRPQFRLTNR